MPERGEGWLYLAVILDLYSRRIVGWAVSNRMKRDLAIRALDMAVALRQPPKGCIHHTDRGSQYCSHDYQKRLKKTWLRNIDERQRKLLRQRGRGNFLQNPKGRVHMAQHMADPQTDGNSIVRIHKWLLQSTTQAFDPRR